TQARPILLFRASCQSPDSRWRHTSKLICKGFAEVKRRRRDSAGRDCRVADQQRGDAHLPIMTSEALMTAVTLSPTLRYSSSTASFVMDDMTFAPWPRSMTTCAVVAPLWTSTTLPLSWLRALSFIIFLRQKQPLLFTVIRGVMDEVATPRRVETLLAK